MFYIEWYQKGKRKRAYFKTLKEAITATNEIFKALGIIMGIERNKK